MADCVETETKLDKAEKALALADETGEYDVIIPITNADLVRKIKSLRTDLKLCNADKAGLRTWREEATDGN